MRELYLHVVHDDDTAPNQEETFVYNSLGEPGLDWSDINTVAHQLAALGIEPPCSLN